MARVFEMTIETDTDLKLTALRRLLKRLLRCYGYKCQAIREREPNVRLSAKRDK